MFTDKEKQQIVAAYAIGITLTLDSSNDKVMSNFELYECVVNSGVFKSRNLDPPSWEDFHKITKILNI